jgi:predicted type IV restriction endonuclease
MVKLFISRVYERKATQRVVEQFRSLVTKAYAQFVADQVSDRLNSALGEDSHVVAAPAAEAASLATAEEKSEGDGIVTTTEELDGFNIVRAILAKDIDPTRVAYRDAEAYFAILLDNNNRHPLVRLHLNSKSVKFITTFENGKEGERHDITCVVDLYKHADRLLTTLSNYVRRPASSTAPVASAPL